MIPGKEHKKEKFSKIAYKRNTGVADSDGLPYTNTEDVSLLAKLGYSIDEDYYLFLPRGEDREDLYSYVEKVAGVSKDVAKCIDQGTSFSGEHLKDMGYEIPEGYEIKGDLVCPIEKEAGLLPEHIIAGTAAGLSLYAIHKQNQKNKKEKKVKPAGIVPVKTAEATHELKSSNIKAVGYDKENKRLEVAFHSGGNYTYNDVPKSLFDRIKRVKSPGKFFHKHIKRDNPYKYERIEKESEYKLHWSKDLHRDVTNNRHYPFSFLTGEAQELADAVKNRDWSNFKEEIGDTTYAAQMLAAQATGLNHPVYADLSKHYAREKVWKDMFKEKSSTYHPKHMEGGSNYAKASKIIKAFASAGIKVDQREAERLANKYTGGKMEKEAGAKIIPAHIRDLMIRRSQGDKSALEALRNIGRANAAKRARLKPVKDLINRTSEPAVVQPKPVAPVVTAEQPVRLDPEVIKARFDEIRRSLGNPGQTKQAYANKLLKEATTFGATRNLLRQMQSQGVKLSRTPKQYVKMINPGSPALLDKAEAKAARTGFYNAKNKVIHVNRNLKPGKSPRNILFHEAGHATHRIEDPILRGKNKYTPENTLARERIANNNAINFMRQNNVPNENVQNYIKQMNNSYKTYLINPRLPFGKAIKNNQKVPQKLQLPPSYSVQIQ
jgi:NTP pyrophosphatase (non-canonical NTP hydrolase)